MSLTYDHYPAVLAAINLISQGRTKTYACDQAGISIPSFEEYVAKDAQLQTLYIDAERRGYDAMADALLTISHNDPKNPYNEPDPKMAKVISDNIKWVLGKRDSKRFGERIEVKHEITMDRAITDALDAARARAMRGGQVDLAPGEYSIVREPLALTQIVQTVVHELDDDEAIMAELLGGQAL